MVKWAVSTIAMFVFFLQGNYVNLTSQLKIKNRQILLKSC